MFCDVIFNKQYFELHSVMQYLNITVDEQNLEEVEQSNLITGVALINDVCIKRNKSQRIAIVKIASRTRNKVDYWQTE